MPGVSAEATNAVERRPARRTNWWFVAVCFLALVGGFYFGYAGTPFTRSDDRVIDRAPASVRRASDASVKVVANARPAAVTKPPETVKSEQDATASRSTHAIEAAEFRKLAPARSQPRKPKPRPIERVAARTPEARAPRPSMMSEQDAATLVRRVVETTSNIESPCILLRSEGQHDASYTLSVWKTCGEARFLGRWQVDGRTREVAHLE